MLLMFEKCSDIRHYEKKRHIRHGGLSLRGILPWHLCNSLRGCLGCWKVRPLMERKKLLSVTYRAGSWSLQAWKEWLFLLSPSSTQGYASPWTNSEDCGSSKAGPVMPSREMDPPEWLWSGPNRGVLTKIKRFWLHVIEECLYPEFPLY